MNFLEFVHTSDIHIGAFGNRILANATLNALEEIVQYVIENYYKYLVIAGDLFHYPRIENYDLLISVVKLFKKLREKKVKVISTLGSHDHSPRAGYTLKLLNEADLVITPIYEYYGNNLVLHPLETEDIVFYALPGLKNNNELNYLRENRVSYSKLAEINRSRKIVLIAHTSVEFAGYKPADYVSRYGRIKISSEEVYRNIPSRFNYIALGHIHFPLPIFEEAETNIAYPGAPIGSDRNDLYETILLRRNYGVNRRFLIVDLNNDKPFVKSKWSDFKVFVKEHSIVYNNRIDDLIKEVADVVKDMNSEYNVLLLKIDNVKNDDQGKVLSELKNIEKKHNVAIYPQLNVKNESEKFIVDIGTLGDLEDIEKKALNEIVEKMGLKTHVDKLVELMNELSKTRPENARKEDFYRQLFKNVEKILEEIIYESRSTS
ncbi:MAG: metallophosphoesterase [Desulfurococcaceae archaeon]